MTPSELVRAFGEVVKAPPEQFLIKRPPNTTLITDFPEQVPNLYVPVLDDEVLELSSHLRAIQKEHRRTGNGLYLVSAFLLAHEAGFFPPIWVLDAIVAAFKEYWDEPQKNSMGLLLGLQKKRGQYAAHVSAARRARDYEIATDMWILEQRFGLTVNEAAEVVGAKYATSNGLKVRWGEGLKDLFTVESMAKLYSSKWRRAFGLTKEHFKTIAPYYSDRYWNHFLKGIPTADLPISLRMKLRLERSRS